ncbi:MAG: YcxB family protein [Candidatus Acidiferrum sp.]
MDSAVNLSFRYSEQDYVRAMRTHFKSRLRLKLDIVVIVLAATLGFYEWRSLNSPWWGMGLILLSGILALVLVVALGIVPRMVFRREPKFRDQYSLAFSEDGIHFQTAHINSQLQWSIYNRALVDAHSFILYHGRRSFTVIPKRVFESPEHLAAFEHLVSQKIPEIVST